MVDVLSVLIVCALVMMSGLFSGLTLGLMGLDKTGLQVIMNGGGPDAKYARKIAPIREDGNLLLCTLLLGNVAVNAALSIVMADMAGGLFAFLISTVTIVILGEIVPQAVCSRFPLAVGARAVYIVQFIKYCLYIMTKPLAMVLDKMLGQELGTIYTKDQLKHFVEMHQQQAMVDEKEGKLMVGALTFSDRTVADVMTPLKKVYMLDVNRKLDFPLMSEVFRSGYSRIPCYDSGKDEKDNIVGLLFVKDLILIDPKDEIPVFAILNFYGRPVHKVHSGTPLKEMLETFKSGKCHMAVVTQVENNVDTDPFYFNTGIVTLEDILELILGEDIEDETDHQVARQLDGISLFDSRRPHTHDVLSPQEVNAVFFFLTGNLEIFSADKRHLSEAGIKALIASAPVIDVKALPELAHHGQEGEVKEVSATVEEKGRDLYQRGAQSDYFTLILDGDVTATSGREGFESTLHRWHTIGADVLELTVDQVNPDLPDDQPVPYIPDFSAKVKRRQKARVLRISREEYINAVRRELGWYIEPEVVAEGEGDADGKVNTGDVEIDMATVNAAGGRGRGWTHLMGKGSPYVGGGTPGGTRSNRAQTLASLTRSSSDTTVVGNSLQSAIQSRAPNPNTNARVVVGLDNQIIHDTHKANLALQQAYRRKSQSSDPSQRQGFQSAQIRHTARLHKQPSFQVLARRARANTLAAREDETNNGSSSNNNTASSEGSSDNAQSQASATIQQPATTTHRVSSSAVVLHPTTDAPAARSAPSSDAQAQQSAPGTADLDSYKAMTNQLAQRAAARNVTWEVTTGMQTADDSESTVCEYDPDLDQDEQQKVREVNARDPVSVPSPRPLAEEGVSSSGAYSFETQAPAPLSAQFVSTGSAPPPSATGGAIELTGDVTPLTVDDEPVEIPDQRSLTPKLSLPDGTGVQEREIPLAQGGLDLEEEIFPVLMKISGDGDYRPKKTGGSYF